MENWSRPARPGRASTIATFSGRKTDPEPGSLRVRLHSGSVWLAGLVACARARRPRGSERRSPAIFRPRKRGGVGVSLDTSFDALLARRHGHLQPAREQVSSLQRLNPRRIPSSMGSFVRARIWVWREGGRGRKEGSLALQCGAKV